MEWFNGKKTYIVAFLGATLGLAQAIWPEFVVPGWLEMILGAAGIAAVRNALPAK